MTCRACSKFLAIDLDAALAGQIDHVQGDYHGYAEFHDLGRHEQVTPQVRSVDNHEDCIRPLHIGNAAKQDIGGYEFVRRVCRE